MSIIKRSSSILRIRPQPVYKITKSERTRTAILNAACNCIWRGPFHEMTVRSVTEPANVSRAAFYHYFKDLHELMETLLDMVQTEIFTVTKPWFEGVSDPIALLNESLANLVDISHRRGPILRAVDDAAATDRQLETAWLQFMKRFDDAVTTRIEADQEQGLIQSFDARPVAIALNRLDAHTLIYAFGQRPKSRPEPIQEALVWIWVSTLYGSKWVGKKSSKLVRKV